MPKFSIIVPVYNAEKYICRCLQSILSQTFLDWECILVDDGSPDRSGDICDKYAKNDSRFIVIHKNNGGASFARNIGIEHAKGQWLIFCDADDYYAKDAFIIINNLIETENVEFVGWKNAKTKGESFVASNNEMSTYRFTTYEFINNKRFIHAVWAYALKSNIVKKNNIKFPESIRFSEDQNFLFKYMAFVPNVLQTDNILYCYFQNVESITCAGSSLTIDKYKDNLKSAIEFSRYAKEHDLQISFVKTVLCFIFSYYITYIGKAPDFSISKVNKDIINTFDTEVSDILSTRDKIKICMKYYMKYIWGVKHLAKLLRFIKKFINYVSK